MIRLVRDQPDRFLDDPVFHLLLSNRTLRNVPPAARAEFVRSVRSAINAAPGLDADRREQLEHALAVLEDST